MKFKEGLVGVVLGLTTAFGSMSPADASSKCDKGYKFNPYIEACTRVKGNATKGKTSIRIKEKRVPVYFACSNKINSIRRQRDRARNKAKTLEDALKNINVKCSSSSSAGCKNYTKQLNSIEKKVDELNKKAGRKIVCKVKVDGKNNVPVPVKYEVCHNYKRELNGLDKKADKIYKTVKHNEKTLQDLDKKISSYYSKLKKTCKQKPATITKVIVKNPNSKNPKILPIPPICVNNNLETVKKYNKLIENYNTLVKQNDKLFEQYKGIDKKLDRNNKSITKIGKDLSDLITAEHMDRKDEHNKILAGQKRTNCALGALPKDQCKDLPYKTISGSKTIINNNNNSNGSGELNLLSNVYLEGGVSHLSSFGQTAFAGVGYNKDFENGLQLSGGLRLHFLGRTYDSEGNVSLGPVDSIFNQQGADIDYSKSTQSESLVTVSPLEANINLGYNIGEISEGHSLFTPYISLGVTQQYTNKNECTTKTIGSGDDQKTISECQQYNDSTVVGKAGLGLKLNITENVSAFGEVKTDLNGQYKHKAQFYGGVQFRF